VSLVAGNLVALESRYAACTQGWNPACWVGLCSLGLLLGRWADLMGTSVRYAYIDFAATDGGESGLLARLFFLGMCLRVGARFVPEIASRIAVYVQRRGSGGASSGLAFCTCWVSWWSGSSAVLTEDLWPTLFRLRVKQSPS
jgi:hypothetical protein